MQVLKEEVRENIRLAAIKCFKASDYEKASMREIAKEAGISVGNLYRYFPNKEAIFTYVIQPVIDIFREKRISERKEFPLLNVNFMVEEEMIKNLLDARMLYREEMYILLLRSKGSKYENAKEFMAEAIKEKDSRIVKKVFHKMNINIQYGLYLDASARGFVESFCVILGNAQTDREFVENVITLIELNVKSIIRTLIGMEEDTIEFRRFSDEEISDYITRRNSARDSKCSEDHCISE